MKILRLLILPLFLLLAVGCNKEDDPLGNTQKLTSGDQKTWKISKVVKNGTDQTLSSNDLSKRYTFKKDNFMTYDDDSQEAENGNWQFKDSETTLVLTWKVLTIDVTTTYSIRSISNTNLVIYRSSGNEETTLIPN